MSIGFIGLGSMGFPMATNLRDAGFEVRGYDVNTEATTRFAHPGADIPASARDAVIGANILVLMVVNVHQAAAVLFDEEVIKVVDEKCVVILMSTCPPGEVSALSKRVEDTGRAFLDAPVSGGVVGAEKGSLSIMISGAKVAFEDTRNVFEAMGANLYYVGEVVGHASMAKAVNQLLCGVHLAAAAEAMSLAEKAGMDTATALEIVSGSAAASWMLRDRGTRMLEEDPSVTSAVDIFVKDLGIVLTAGASAKAALPLAATAHQLFLAVSGQGSGSKDDSQVIMAYRGLAGTLK